MGQSESLAASPDPLIQRQSAGGEASDREQGQKDGRCGRRNLEHAGQEDAWC